MPPPNPHLGHANATVDVYALAESEDPERGGTVESYAEPAVATGLPALVTQLSATEQTALGHSLDTAVFKVAFFEPLDIGGSHRVIWHDQTTGRDRTLGLMGPIAERVDLWVAYGKEVS